MALTVFAGVSWSNADVVVNQPSPNLAGSASQHFEAANVAFNIQALDDITLTQAYNLTTLTAFGSNSIAGGEAFNLNVVGQIWSAGDLGSTLVMSSVSGSQTGDDLTIDFGGQLLNPGTYWISAFVERPFTGGGQWFWDNASGGPYGAPARHHNPGGGFGFGSAPIDIAGPVDMAFTLNGDLAAIPEPSAISALVLGAALLAGRRRR